MQTNWSLNSPPPPPRPPLSISLLVTSPMLSFLVFFFLHFIPSPRPVYLFLPLLQATYINALTPNHACFLFPFFHIISEFPSSLADVSYYLHEEYYYLSDEVASPFQDHYLFSDVSILETSIRLQDFFKNSSPFSNTVSLWFSEKEME